MDLDEYARYMEATPAVAANALLRDVCDSNDTELDLGTPLNKVKFLESDLSKAIEGAIVGGEGLTDHFERLDTLAARLDVKIGPSAAQLRRSYARLDENIVKPYSECMDIHRTLKRAHATNRLVRGARVALELALQIHSERKLLEKCLLINEFDLHMDRCTYLRPIKSLEPHLTQVEDTRAAILKKIQQDLASLGVYKTTSTAAGVTSELVGQPILANATELETTLRALETLEPDGLTPIADRIFTATLAHCTALVTRNINNAKLLPSIVRGVGPLAENLSKLEAALKNTAAHDRLQNTQMANKLWMELSIAVEPKIRDVVTRGGPVARNFKAASAEIEAAIRTTAPKHDNIELMVLNAFKIQS